jgi:hypothetical protein
VASDKTVITELSTALGMLRYREAAAAIAARAPELDLTDDAWAHLVALHDGGRYDGEFAAGFANGVAFLEARDGLRHRPPVLIEWTGGRKAPGDEVAPIDLRVDHVYQLSCKYLSKVLANASPARVFEGLLATRGTWERGDWYQVVAPAEHQALYDAYRLALGLVGDLPARVSDLRPEHRGVLRAVPRARTYPPDAREPHLALCRKVSKESADRWARSIGRHDGEVLLWRLLRIGSAPYFVLGARAGDSPVRLRVASPWDWRQHFELLSIAVAPSEAGQPQVDWTASVRRRATGEVLAARGHVEVRWSHGRFVGPPEAKVYADTPIDELPGYFALQ